MNITSFFHLFMIKLIEITGCDKKSSNNMILLGVSIKIFEFAFLYFTYIYYVEKFNDVKFILVIIVGMSITSLWFLIAYYLKKYF